jgi:hypothetical protein
MDKLKMNRINPIPRKMAIEKMEINVCELSSFTSLVFNEKLKNEIAFLTLK